MADWVNIPDSALDPDAPLTSELAYAWRDNVAGALEGVAGAPRLFISAIQRLAPGESERAVYAVPEISADAAVWEGMRFGFLQAGSLRVRFQHRANVPSGEARVARLRAGAATLLASWVNGTSYVERAIDVSVLPGDAIIVLQEYPAAGTPPVSYLYNIRLLTGGQDLWPGTPAPVVNNAYA